MNGVWGNVGLAFAALLSGLLAELAGWRAAFFVPGLACIAAGFGFLWASRGIDVEKRAAKKGGARLPRALLVRVFFVVAIATACGGLIFNATTVSMPKVFDERLKALTETTFGVGMLVCITYLIAAMAQLLVGSWIDRRSLKGVFVAVAGLQVPLLARSRVAHRLRDARGCGRDDVCRFRPDPDQRRHDRALTADEWRARAYAVRYVVSFGASAAAVPLIAWIHQTTETSRPCS